MAKENTQKNDSCTRRSWDREDSLEVHSIGYLVTRPGWKGKTHSHPVWEFLYYIRGEGTFLYEDRDFPITPGTCFIIPPGIEHRLTPKTGTSFDHVYFLFSVSPFNVEPDRVPYPGTLPPHVIEPLRRASDMVRAEDGASVASKTSAAVLQALGALTEYLQVSEDDPDPNISEHRIEWIVNKCKEFIEGASSRALTVEEVAESLYLSPHYVGTLFREQTGSGIKEYHTEIRLARAVEMIRSGEYNLTEIAEELGFGTLHYFSRIFKKHFGVPPSEFS